MRELKKYPVLKIGEEDLKSTFIKSSYLTEDDCVKIVDADNKNTTAVIYAIPDIISSIRKSGGANIVNAVSGKNIGDFWVSATTVASDNIYVVLPGLLEGFGAR